MKKFNSFRKQDSLLAASIRRYLKSFGTDYLYRRPGLQLRPEDFFRGVTPNLNFNFPEINQVVLDRRSKLILQDQFQLRALLNILSPSFLSLIRGGPGTGKTLLAAVAIKQFIINNQVVIITSHSNQALDNLLAAVGEHVDGDYIFRLGNDIKQIANKSRKYHRHWRYQSMTSSYGQYWGRTAAECEIDSQGREIEELLNNGQGLVLAVTLDSYQSDNFLRSLGKKNSSRQINLRPNIAFVDEATKANFYQLWPIIKSVSDKLVFFGDPDQLGNIDIPPVILNKLIKYMIESLSNDPFYQVDIGRSNGDCLPSIHVSDQELAAELAYFNKGPFRRLINENFPTSDLLINRRSLPAIVKMINYVFGKNLICGRFNPNNEGEVVVLDVEGEAAAVGTSYFNKGEACLVRQELLKYFFGQSKLDPTFNFNSVATIASYQGQVLSIREKLRQDLLFRPMFKHLVNPGNLNEILFELINSVDKFQGGERDAIFVSFVSANKIGWLGFNAEVERFFVAATRARNLLVIFLNAATFLHSDEDIQKISGRLIHYAQQEKTYSKKRVC